MDSVTDMQKAGDEEQRRESSNQKLLHNLKTFFRVSIKTQYACYIYCSVYQ